MRFEIAERKTKTGSFGPAASKSLPPFLTDRDSLARPNSPVSSALGRGFTLLELMMVLTLILILASFAFPQYRTAVLRAREAVLRNDLYTMRKLIDQFTLDKHRPPNSLAELVEAGYLRGGIPKDPLTNSDETWRADEEDSPLSTDQAASSGVVDVHSGSDAISLEGTPYNTW